MRTKLKPTSGQQIEYMALVENFTFKRAVFAFLSIIFVSFLNISLCECKYKVVRLYYRCNFPLQT